MKPDAIARWNSELSHKLSDSQKNLLRTVHEAGPSCPDLQGASPDIAGVVRQNFVTSPGVEMGSS